MADQYRDTCVDRQNKTRKEFRENSIDLIRVSFYDKDGERIDDVTRSEANCVAASNPQQLFYFQDGDGYLRELLIDGVNLLSVNDHLPSGKITGYTSGVGQGGSDSVISSSIERANDSFINQNLDRVSLDVPEDLGVF
jgi:hypothetical protein